MSRQNLWSYIDHTLLKATATWDDICKICREAVENKAASACIPPYFVKRAKETFGNELNICTVIGFPLGYNAAAVKVAEARQAICDGAGEIDMVINLGDVKAGSFSAVTKEIASVRDVSAGKILKVIIETCYLSADEKAMLCGCVKEAGADFIKTSTGFGTGGATLEDVKLLASLVGPDVKVKASGGISSLKDMLALIDAGAVRIGTSRAMDILKTTG